MKQDGYANIVTSKSDFDGWEILLLEDFKPGVKRIYMRRIEFNGEGSFLIVYSDEKYTKELQVNADPA